PGPALMACRGAPRLRVLDGRCAGAGGRRRLGRPDGHRGGRPRGGGRGPRVRRLPGPDPPFVDSRCRGPASRAGAGEIVMQSFDAAPFIVISETTRYQPATDTPESH